MSKEDTLSSYINHAIKELHKQIKTTDTVDMVSLFNNAVLDFTSKMVVGQDLGAMNAHGTIHSSLKVLNRIIRYIYIPIQMQRLPRIILYPIEIITRFFSMSVLHIDGIRPLVERRVENGGIGNDFGINFHV